MSRLALPPHSTKVLETDGTMARQWYDFFGRVMRGVAQVLPPVGDGTNDAATAAITVTPWTSQRCDPTSGSFIVTLPPIVAGDDDMEVAITEVGGSPTRIIIVPAALPTGQTILRTSALNITKAFSTTRLRADTKTLNWIYA